MNHPAAAALGSSPLTRGKQVRVRLPPGAERLIPAHAGKTCSVAPLSMQLPAHPRSRGENRVFRQPGEGGEGSSPLTRGKQALELYLASLCGLIPAHAGKTQMLRIGPLRKAAHPRSRGENRRAG